MPAGRWLLTVTLALLPFLAPATASAESDVRTSNSSENTETESGDANASNSSGGFVGHNNSSNTNVRAQDVNNSTGTNVQEGDNSAEVNQTATAHSGDAISGQAVGASGGGDVTVNASNSTIDSSATTGDANANNSLATFIGLAVGSSTTITADITNVTATNVQEGDNTGRFDQTADAVTGDGITGQIVAPIASSGGSVSITAGNETIDSEVDTGDATSANDLAAFIGLNVSTLTITADISNATAANLQEGDNDFDADQTATSHSGDGIGGQVIAASAAGSVNLDADNTTEDSTVDTGDATATNEGAAATGLNFSTLTTIAAAINNVSATNVQEGGNAGGINQLADASSGNGVAGQVAGAVGGGGVLNATLRNTSVGSESSSGDSAFANVESLFIGLSVSTDLVIL